MLEQRDQMRDFLAQYCLLLDAKVRLSSGNQVSSFYFDCKRATLNGNFLIGLADWILQAVVPTLAPSATVVGGPTLGADFIAAAVVIRAHQQHLPLTTGCIVRKEPKQHGTKNKIENEPPSPARVLIVEDVITTGSSIARACDEFLAAGHTIAAITAIIDREAGGRAALAEKYGVPVFTLFNRSDFPEAN